MIDLPYYELQDQQREICRRQRMERWIQDHPQGRALPQPQDAAPSPVPPTNPAEEKP